jgi:D-galactonate transporter
MSNPGSAIRPGGSYAAPIQKSEEDAVWSKINWRLIPIILLAYIMAFLDRINVGYGKLTMQQDLGFSDAIYGLGAGLFFITYLMFEVPSNLWLEKIGARLSFLRIMVLWGLASAATAWITTPTHFYIIRLLLGVFEAGFFPGVILFLTYWYPSHRRGRVTGLFLFGMPITGVFGGPLSGWIMKNFEGVSGWHGWQWMFLLEGIPTVFIGVLLYFMLVNKPAEAKFLSERERQVVKQVMDADAAKRGAAKTKAHGKLMAALSDPKTWILAFVYFTCACSVYTLTFWMPTMVKSLGITDIATVGWYTAIPFAGGALGILLFSRSSDHFEERRWHVAAPLIIGSVALYATTLLGGALVPTMAVLTIAAFFTFAGGVMFWSIPPTYLSPEQAATGIAVISSLGILGGFVSPTLLGWVKATTGSLNNGLLFMMAVIVLGGLTLLLAVPKSTGPVPEGSGDAAH